MIVGPGYLDKIAEYPVKADLQRFDAGGFPFLLLKLSQPLLALGACLPGFVQFPAEALPDDASVPDGDAGVRGNRLLQQCCDVRQLVQVLV